MGPDGFFAEGNGRGGRRKMATRKIRTMGDPILKKRCKEVKEVTPRIRELIGDMFETMYGAEGVGLAAPQVGVLRRLVVIDTTGEDPMVLINPEILETSGQQTGGEGCLSVPGKTGSVTRPSYVRARAYDAEMREYQIEATDLLARAILHEVDHLEGKLYVNLVEGPLMDTDAYYQAHPEELPREDAPEGPDAPTGKDAADGQDVSAGPDAPAGPGRRAGGPGGGCG